MGTVWDATKLMLLVYGLAAVVSFLVACVIQFTFVLIRLQGARSAASAQAQASASAASGKPGSGA